MAIFDSNSHEEVEKKLKLYLMNDHSIPCEILRFIKRNLEPNLSIYTTFLSDMNIQKTSSHAESYFHSAMLHKKKLYKTIRGLTSYLQYHMELWTEKYGVKTLFYQN